MESSRRRVLVVANRTAATPDLLAVVRRYADEQPTAFTLLIPDAGDGDWTLESALPLLERAARGPVAGLEGDTVGHYDQVIVSTRPRWLRRDLPRRVEALGVPVEVIEAARTRDLTAAELGLSWPQCSLCRVSAARARGRTSRS